MISKRNLGTLARDASEAHLRDIRLEEGQNAPDVSKDLAEYCSGIDLLGEYVGLSERYKRGDLAVHVHFSVSREIVTTDYCAVVESVFARLRDDWPAVVVDDVGASSMPDTCGYREPSVLVDVFELIEDPK